MQHGHLGLTSSTITAQLINGMICSRPSPFDLVLYLLGRLWVHIDNAFFGGVTQAIRLGWEMSPDCADQAYTIEKNLNVALNKPAIGQ